MTSAKEQSAGALAGLKVLDLSRVLAGPWCSQLLADLGADVVKVERPSEGDDTRRWGPPWLQDSHGQPTSESAYFLSANRNKRSLTIDIRQPEGQRLVCELASQADVLIENFKTNGLTQYGLDYQSLAKVNPRLTYCSVTGFGHTGPYAERPGYDFLVQGMGGLMSLTGYPDGAPGGGPIKVGVALTDVMTGLYATIAILAALRRRDVSGEGQHIDLALLDVQVAVLANQASNYLVGGQVPSRLGNAHPNIVPYQDFPTADGYMILAVGNDGQFGALCQTLGHPEWALDERFRTNESRVRNRQALVPLISDVTCTRNTSEWIKEMEWANVPCGPINSLDRVFEDAQVIARGMRISMHHSADVDVSLVANPIRFSESPVSYRRAPPMLGEHTEQVLGEWLSLDADALTLLRSKKVI